MVWTDYDRKRFAESSEELWPGAKGGALDAMTKGLEDLPVAVVLSALTKVYQEQESYRRPAVKQIRDRARELMPVNAREPTETVRCHFCEGYRFQRVEVFTLPAGHWLLPDMPQGVAIQTRDMTGYLIDPRVGVEVKECLRLALNLWCGRCTKDGSVTAKAFVARFGERFLTRFEAERDRIRLMASDVDPGPVVEASVSEIVGDEEFWGTIGASTSMRRAVYDEFRASMRRGVHPEARVGTRMHSGRLHDTSEERTERERLTRELEGRGYTEKRLRESSLDDLRAKASYFARQPGDDE